MRVFVLIATASLAIAPSLVGTVVAQTRLDHPVIYQLSYDFEGEAADDTALAFAPPGEAASAPAAKPVPAPVAPEPQAAIEPVPCPASDMLDDACGAGLACAPRWTFAADALLLQRSSAGDQPLLRDNWDHNGSELLNAQDLNFSVTGGPRFTAIRHGRRWDAEISYFQLDGFFASQAFTTQALGGQPLAGQALAGPAYLVTDVDGANFIVDDPVVHYSSRLYSAEFNLRRPRNEWLTVLAGLRAVELNEHYRAEGIGRFTPVPVAFFSNTHNHLYGFQLGLDAAIYQRGRLSIDGMMKAGIYYNDASQNSRQVDTGFSDESLGAEESHTAFLGELGLLGVYQLTDQLAFRAGYQLMWIEGVALAPEQIGANDFDLVTAGVDTSGGVFYHGAVVGAEFTW